MPFACKIPSWSSFLQVFRFFYLFFLVHLVLFFWSGNISRLWEFPTHTETTLRFSPSLSLLTNKALLHSANQSQIITPPSFPPIPCSFLLLLLLHSLAQCSGMVSSWKADTVKEQLAWVSAKSTVVLWHPKPCSCGWRGELFHHV